MDSRTRTKPDLSTALARNAACLLGCCLLGLFAVLYLAAPALYTKVLPVFFFFDGPTQPPFQDLRAVMTSIDCWQRGLHSYVGSNNACVGFNYSPIWLRLPFLAKSVLNVDLAAIVLAVAFFLSMRWLPLQRSRRGLLLMVLAAVSSACVFAVERANVDVLLYLFCLGGALCLGLHWPRRAVAYLFFGIAGFLKFYPIVLMGLVLRERLHRLLAVLGLLAIAALAFYWMYGEEMREVLTGVAGLNAHWGPFTDRFGARQLPDGLWLLMSDIAPPNAFELLPGNDAVNPVPPRWAMPALALLAVAVAVWQWRRPAFAAGWQALSRAEADFLLVGAITVAGCFFAGYSIAYRGIFLLLALPGLIAMAATTGKLFWVGLPVAVVYNLWAPTIQHLIFYAAKFSGQPAMGRALALADWSLHEIAWWWSMAAFIAVMLQLVIKSPALAFLRPGLAQPRGAAATRPR